VFGSTGSVGSIVSIGVRHLRQLCVPPCGRWGALLLLTLESFVCIGLVITVGFLLMNLTLVGCGSWFVQFSCRLRNSVDSLACVSS
jgi:hypothetical protein